LHTAPLSGKRLVTLWNALPSAEKRRRVGDREALIDHLWSAIEALPDPEPEPDAKRPGDGSGPHADLPLSRLRPRQIWAEICGIG